MHGHDRDTNEHFIPLVTFFFLALLHFIAYFFLSLQMIIIKFSVSTLPQDFGLNVGIVDGGVGE